MNKDITKFFENILGAKNVELHKVVRIFGLKFELKLKRLELQKQIKDLREEFNKLYLGLQQQLQQQETIFCELLTKEFKKHNISPKSILMVEPNNYHGEVLSGFVKYFNDLGYNVDLLLRPNNSVEDIFSRWNTFPKVFYGSANNIKTLLKLKKVEEYDYVFFSSSCLLV
ncbi:MAG: hypothetical protein LBS29_05545 [Endomicrobium sp.]|jgi:hypothetical protein|nr:hypothetical protein [Endomicrobium sp.]